MGFFRRFAQSGGAYSQIVHKFSFYLLTKSKRSCIIAGNSKRVFFNGVFAFFRTFLAEAPGHPRSGGKALSAVSFPPRTGGALTFRSQAIKPAAEIRRECIPRIQSVQESICKHRPGNRPAEANRIRQGLREFRTVSYTHLTLPTKIAV